MEKKSNFRVKVMKFAWAIFRATKNEWSLCMRKAWNLWRLAKKMRSGAVRFAYLKADGTIRQAIGTLLNLPAGASLKGKKMTKPSYKTFAYYDVEKRAFRCFKAENLLYAI